MIQALAVQAAYTKNYPQGGKNKNHGTDDSSFDSANCHGESLLKSWGHERRFTPDIFFP